MKKQYSQILIILLDLIVLSFFLLIYFQLDAPSGFGTIIPINLLVLTGMVVPFFVKKKKKAFVFSLIVIVLGIVFVILSLQYILPREFPVSGEWVCLKRSYRYCDFILPSQYQRYETSLSYEEANDLIEKHFSQYCKNLIWTNSKEKWRAKGYPNSGPSLPPVRNNALDFNYEFDPDCHQNYVIIQYSKNLYDRRRRVVAARVYEKEEGKTVIEFWNIYWMDMDFIG